MGLRDILDAFSEADLAQLARDIETNRVESARVERIRAAIQGEPEADFIAVIVESEGFREVVDVLDLDVPVASPRDIGGVISEDELTRFATQIEDGSVSPIIQQAFTRAFDGFTQEGLADLFTEFPVLQTVFNALGLEIPPRGEALELDTRDEGEGGETDTGDGSESPDVQVGLDQPGAGLAGGGGGGGGGVSFPEAPNTPEVLDAVATQLETKWSVRDRPVPDQKAELEKRFPVPQRRQEYIQLERDRVINQQEVVDPETYFRTFEREFNNRIIRRDEWLAAQGQRFIYSPE